MPYSTYRYVRDKYARTIETVIDVQGMECLVEITYHVFEGEIDNIDDVKLLVIYGCTEDVDVSELDKSWRDFGSGLCFDVVCDDAFDQTSLREDLLAYAYPGEYE